jgi:hypothetical protein
MHSSGVHHGRLTSVLMGIVDTIDNLAEQHASRRGGQSASIVDAAPPVAVPQLHRSDGGMGGIGRASEENSIQFNSTQITTEEESSFEMAREFLSRLLLMLACFVVLCLLLF